MSQHQQIGEMPPNAAKPEPQASGPAGPSGGNELASPPSAQAIPPAPPAPPARQTSLADSGNGSEPLGPRPGRRHLVFGAAGLGVGLIAGIGLGQINIPFTSNALETATESCSVMETFGIDLGDNGQSIAMSSEGEDSAGAEYADISCVLAELEVPDSVEARIGTTRALDGRQSADWGKFTASWGYHPDSGLNIVIEIADR